MTKEQLSKEVFEKLDSLSFEKCKDRIIFRLIPNREEIENEQEYLPFLDLNLGLYILFESCNDQLVTIKITKNIIDKWKVSQSQLYHYAKINTPKLLPAKTKNMFDYINENYNINMENNEDNPNVLILTNTYYINGATCLAYPDVIDHIAQKFDKNLYILPSSIHEILILPDEDGKRDLQSFSSMVREINQTTVEEKDFLSDNAYYYNIAEKKFEYEKCT